MAPPKSLDSDKNFKPIYAILSQIKICRNLRTFWRSLGKKSLFGSKTVFLGQEVHYYRVYIAYFKNDAFVAKIVNKRLTNIFMVIFATDKRLPSSATLVRRMEWNDTPSFL